MKFNLIFFISFLKAKQSFCWSSYKSHMAQYKRYQNNLGKHVTPVYSIKAPFKLWQIWNLKVWISHKKLLAVDLEPPQHLRWSSFWHHFKIKIFRNHMTLITKRLSAHFLFNCIKSVKQKIDQWHVLSFGTLSPLLSIASRYCPYFWC